MSKKLLFVTSRLPWPTNSGRKESLYHYCRLLATHHGYEVTLFVFPEWDQPRVATDKPSFIKSVHFAHPFGTFSKFFSLFGCLFSPKTPFQCALYRSRKNRRTLKRLVNALAPDVILFDMIRTAPYMQDFYGKVRCILDLDDLLSVRYARQLAEFDENTGIAGRYGGGMPRGMEKLLCHGKIGKLILKAEQKRVARAELYYARRSNGVILVSPEEAAAFGKRVPQVPVVALPVGVDTAALQIIPTPPKSPKTGGFIGNMSVEANLSSLRYIREKILPYTPPDFRLEVVGHCPEQVRAAFSGEPRLVFLGEVDTLAPVIRKWQLMLSPIAFGSGIKTKILTAMAAELPVLTNSVGAEGIAAQNGKEIFVCDTEKELVSTLHRLLADADLCRTMGKNALAFVSTHFDWETLSPLFHRLELS